MRSITNIYYLVKTLQVYFERTIRTTVVEETNRMPATLRTLTYSHTHSIVRENCSALATILTNVARCPIPQFLKLAP